MILVSFCFIFNMSALINDFVMNGWFFWILVGKVLVRLIRLEL